MTRGAWIAVGASTTLAVVLAIVLIVVIAVDGDDSSPAADETAAPAEPAIVGPMGGGLPPEASECLSEQGVEPPAPGSGIPDEAEIERMREALEECGLDGPQVFTPGH